ncbi:MAG: hypothetical protein OXF74_02975 [Rhodobacteraceae bacterium]|nr:hypothetical protein [Paracoccaceae bacterium]
MDIAFADLLQPRPTRACGRYLSLCAAGDVVAHFWRFAAVFDFRAVHSAMPRCADSGSNPGGHVPIELQDGPCAGPAALDPQVHPLAGVVFRLDPFGAPEPDRELAQREPRRLAFERRQKPAAVYRHKVERLGEALKRPDERAEAADAIRGLIERIVLTPGEKWGEVHATLHGDLATIVEWTGNGGDEGGTGTPGSGLSVSAETGTRLMRVG